MDSKENLTKSQHHEPVIEIKDVSREFYVGKNQIKALENIQIQVAPADFIVIFGPSGCGKSTLLNTILGLDEPSKGEVRIRGTNIYKLNDDARAKFRAKKIGMVHQMPYWIKSLNTVENVAMPLIIEGVPEVEAIKHATHVLEQVNISKLAKQRPTELSGGQQQRVGLARALVSNPWIIMADEPTGNLDTTTSDEIMAVFDRLNVEHKRTIILVTHNTAYWELGNRRIEMKDGKVVKDTSHHHFFKSV